MNRRALCVLLSLSVIGSAPAQASGPSPTDMIAAIYRRAAAGTGESGGQFLYSNAKNRRANFTSSTAELWNRAARVTPRGDQTPPGFDPVTNSQDPSLKAFVVSAEAIGPKRARILVRLTSRTSDGDRRSSVRYLLVREGGRWLIDDITGATEGTPWSIRPVLDSHLASYGRPAGRTSSDAASGGGRGPGSPSRRR